MRLLYTAIVYLCTPLALARLWWRGRKLPAYRRRWCERFGFFTPPATTPTVWVHAVSVGEFQAALPFIRWLIMRGEHILITTTTPTGSERVRAALGEQVFHVYAPYDLRGAVTRFLDRARPRLAIIMETELWPNLFHACRVRGIPIIVANARLSARSAAGYARIARLTRATLGDTTIIAAQSQMDAERFIDLGADAARVQVMGNIKFDVAVPKELSPQADALRASWGERPVWIAASTHAGEEEQVLTAHSRIRALVPHALLILVPRHPDRFAQVAALCRQQGFAICRRSEGLPYDAGAAVFLGDTMGELMLFYAAADVAFVGGSLVPTGGHNVLEPAALGIPVIVGPHTFNFAAIMPMLIEQSGGVCVHDADELAQAVVRYLMDADLRRTTGSHALSVVSQNRGALDALIRASEEWLEI